MRILVRIEVRITLLVMIGVRIEDEDTVVVRICNWQ